jgi:hypothetical protein
MMGISVCMALAALLTPQAGSSRPTIPAVKALADQLPCTVEFVDFVTTHAGGSRVPGVMIDHSPASLGNCKDLGVE